MSYDPAGFSRKSVYGHEKVYESSSKVGSSYSCTEKLALNGITNCPSRHEDGNQRRNYKLLIDPAIKKGYQKIYRYDGEFPGQAPIILRDPRPRRTRIWTLNKADLPVPNFKIDKHYVGVPPQREVIFSGLNDNVDKRFLQEMCQNYGNIQTIKVYYDPLTKKHTGKARVTFDLTKSAKQACTSLDQTSVMGNIIRTQLEPNIKGARGHPKHHRSESTSSTKGLDDNTIIQTGQSFLPPSKQFGIYPTPPSSHSSHSPSVESNLCTSKVHHPVDPRIKNAHPTTPPPPDTRKDQDTPTNDRGSVSSHSGHDQSFPLTRSVIHSGNSFEPISPPHVKPANVPPPPPLSVQKPHKSPSTPPMPANATSSYMGYEDISPEPVFSPGEELSKPKKIPLESTCDTFKISKLIECYRRDSGKHTPPRELPMSPKADRYRNDHHRGNDARHDRDDRHDKYRDRYEDYRSRDHRDDRDYSRCGSKRSDYKLGYHHDSRRDDYKSRKDYRSEHRDSYDRVRDDYDRRRDNYDRPRHSDNHRDEPKYKRRDDRYTTSPRRAEERDRYASSPRRSESRKKTDFREVYGKESYSIERNIRRSPPKERKEIDSLVSEPKRVSIPKEILSDLDVKSDSSLSSDNKPSDLTQRNAPSTPKENVVDIISSVISGTPGNPSKLDLYDEAYTLGVEACSDDEPLPPGDEPCIAHEVQLDRVRNKIKLAQDVVRKRKLSSSEDEIHNGNKAKKISIVFKSNQLNRDESSTLQEEYSDNKRGVWQVVEPTTDSEGSRTPEEDVSTDLPQVEDISPCPSPAGAMTINVISKSEEQSNLYCDIETTDSCLQNNKADDDDDAMSLSSISSNEDSLEVNAPVKNVVPAKKTVVVPPPNVVFPFPPPPIIPIPPPPAMFNPHVPPPMIGPVTVPPPPLVPPPNPTVPPPALVQTLPSPSVPPPPLGLPTRPSVAYLSQRVGYNGPGFMPNYKGAGQTTAWAWKVQVIDAVAKTIHAELSSVLTRDVFRKLVEASAFKSLDAWWDNQTKPKVNSPLQSVVSNLQQVATSTVGQPSISSTSTPGLGPSPFDRSHSMAPGLRASLPKLPTFKRKMAEELPKEETSSFQDQVPKLHQGHIPKRRRLPDSEAESEHDAEVESSSREGEGWYRTISRLEEDDEERSLSPWHLEDSMDAPAAISVRKSEDRRTSTGASLYQTVYSSESEVSDEQEEEEEESSSESESDESDEESEEEASDESEYDSEAEEEEGMETLEVAHEVKKAVKEGTISREGDLKSETSEIPLDISQRDLEQSTRELSEREESDFVPQSRVETVTLSQIVTYQLSDDALDSLTQEEKIQPMQMVEDDEVNMDVGLERNISGKRIDTDDLFENLATDTGNKEPKKESESDELSIVNKAATKKVLSIDLSKEPSTSDDMEHSHQLFSPGGHSIASLVELDHSYGLVKREGSPFIDILGLNEEPIEAVEEEHAEETKLMEPPKTIFPPRSFEADDELVYELLKCGLDYEDAHYLKVGFERLLQVGSESVHGGKWCYHTATQPSPLIVSSKRRRLRSEQGVRIHFTGCARSEGYYKIDMKEKAKYAENIRRQVAKEEVLTKDETKLDASKGKQQSRENRAMQRRLQSAVCNEDFGDILKFNKLRVRKKQLKFAKSSIHAWGLFALEPIAADEMVIEYVGEVIRQAIADYRERCYEERGIGSSYMFRLDEDTIIDATTQGNFARFINHCCDPNCYAKVIAVENMKKIVIYSKRDIQVNEEITYDYKFPLEDEKISCLCGAPQCRGTLN